MLQRLQSNCTAIFGGGENLFNTFLESDIISPISERQAYSSIRDYYIERTGPAELLNTNLKIPWTLNRQPTFTGILHVGEDVPIIKTAATINDKYSPNVIVNGNEITFTPDCDLDYGFNRVYVSVAFENGHTACAYWNFEVKKNPPQISGFLGDAKGRRYFICFDGEIDSKKIEYKSNWKLNGSSDLIEKVDYMDFGDWAVVYLVDESKHQDFRDQDYQLSYDSGRGATECLLIPEEKQPRDGGCGSVSHDDINDVHFSFESELHALTYEVTYEDPECDLEVEWLLDTKSVVNHSIAADTPLIFDRDSSDITPQQMIHNFPVGPGHHTLFFPWDCHSRLKVKVYEPGDPPVTVWESPEWNFPADTSTPEYTLSPVMMNGEDAAVFVEQHYWEKTQLPQGELPLQIQNMVDSLNSPLTRCRKLVLWGAEDRFGGQPHIGCLSCYNYLDWGADINENPDGIWCPEPMSLWDAFMVDLPPYRNIEYRQQGWSDPEYCPFPIDALSTGEYKLWVFDYEGWINAHQNDIAGHEDTFIMRPRVNDIAGNWLRAENIYRFTSCDDIELIFHKPATGNRIQYINLDAENVLPATDNVPLDQRGDEVEIEIEIILPEFYVLPEGAKLFISWIDKPIDTSPLTTMNPPGKIPRPIFPWLSDSRKACSCSDDCEVWPYAEDIYFPNPGAPPTGCLPDDYPNHVDNSYPCKPEYTDPYCFSNLPSAYGHDFSYSKPGFGEYRNHVFEIDVDSYELNEDCRLIFETTFYTSNFGGDNYQFIAWVEIPAQGCATPIKRHNGVTNVWRKAYIEMATMANYIGDPRYDDYLSPDYETYNYKHYDGPFYSYWYLTYFRNAFDDCFIDMQWSDVGYLDTTYQDIILNSNDLVSYMAPCPLTTPHGIQVLDCDHYHHHPVSFMDLPLGLTADPDENHHTLVAYGTIWDIFPRLDYKRINHKKVKNRQIIIGITATHEVGHAVAFHNMTNHQTVGHFSGPGLMWSSEGLPCQVLSRKNGRRMSHFWGDHVFIMRLDPEL